MIHSIKSNNPNFKSVTFHSGFNIILADLRHDDKSEDKQTRNGAVLKLRRILSLGMKIL